jgi:hypothetical protein
MDNFVYPLPLFFDYCQGEKQLNARRSIYGRC